MIKVTYKRDVLEVTVEGHARSGEVGHDLVCASASILCYTLASFIENLVKAGQANYPTTSLNEGNAVICCFVPDKYIKPVTLVYDAICGGFELLARDYPDNISYEITNQFKENTNGN